MLDSACVVETLLWLKILLGLLELGSFVRATAEGSAADASAPRALSPTSIGGVHVKLQPLCSAPDARRRSIRSKTQDSRLKTHSASSKQQARSTSPHSDVYRVSASIGRCICMSMLLLNITACRNPKPLMKMAACHVVSACERLAKTQLQSRSPRDYQ